MKKICFSLLLLVIASTLSARDCSEQSHTKNPILDLGNRALENAIKIDAYEAIKPLDVICNGGGDKNYSDGNRALACNFISENFYYTKWRFPNLYNPEIANRYRARACVEYKESDACDTLAFRAEKEGKIQQAYDWMVYYGKAEYYGFGSYASRAHGEVHKRELIAKGAKGLLIELPQIMKKIDENTSLVYDGDCNETGEEQRVLDLCTKGKDGTACAKVGLNHLSKGDSDEAIWWFQKAWAYGEGTAAYALAGYYINGLSGYPKDIREAVRLLDTGCFQGNDSMACSTAAKIYDFGEGVAPDIKLATKYYIASCKFDPSNIDSCSHVPSSPKISNISKRKK